MRKVVIFGAGKIADVVHYYLAEAEDLEIAAFTCDAKYIDSNTFNGLPVVPFDDVAGPFPPDDFAMFVALGYQDLNRLRADRMARAKSKGYQLFSFIHPNARVPRNVTVGENCFIMDHACVQPWVTLGDNVFVWGNATVGHHSAIEDNCWITSNANIAGVVRIGKNTFVGINATIGNNVTIGENCFIGANALVTQDLPDDKVIIQKSSEIFRLTSHQFLKMSKFT